MDMMDMVPILGFSLRGNFVYFSLFFIWYSHREINDKYNYHSSTWIIHPIGFHGGKPTNFHSSTRTRRRSKLDRSSSGVMEDITGTL
jgi:hypothetical protein